MATMYRERVSISGSAPIGASVYVVSAATVAQNGGVFDKRTIIVSIPARHSIAVTVADVLAWRGQDYVIQDSAVPIIALGRIDHWEITATRTLGA